MFRKKMLVVSMGLFFSMSGCGGGSKSSSNINSHKQIVGDWITGCENHQLGKSRVRSVSYPEKKSDNSQNFLLVSALYDQSNCSGTGTVIGFGGSIDYRGEFTTSICITEKTDINLTAGLIGEIEVSGSDLQQLFIDAGLVNPSSNIACKHNNQLLTGLFTTTLNGSSDSTRPTEMNVSDPFNHWDRASSKSKKEIGIPKTRLQSFYSDFISVIK